MKTSFVTAMLVLFIAALACAQEPVASAPSVSAPTAPSGVASTLADRVDVGVTAYNSGIALVRDVRTLSAPTGEHKLQFMDVSQQIRPETVSLRSLDAPGAIAILEQNYEYDLMSPNKLMEKYVGKKVKLVNFSTQIGFQEVDADLLSNNDGPIYKIGDRIYLGHPGNVVLPEIPANLIAKPTLVWEVNNALPDQKIEVSYLTDGVTWQVDYVLTLAKDDATMDLAGWVTLSNQSGTEYTNAELKLVAGDVNLAPRSQLKVRADMSGYAEGKMAPAPPREESFAEYHLYTVPRRTTIKQNQTKQISLLTAAQVGIRKEYETSSDHDLFTPFMRPDSGPIRQDVAVLLKFMNAEKAHLGIPLPAGTMRVYKQDSSGALQFAGEDRIRHTPKNEEVRLGIGKAFDIAVERTQTDFQQPAQNISESAFKIVVRNHKDTEVTVNVVERMYGDWRILEKSREFSKRDAATAVFPVTVPKDGEATVTYRAQTKR